MRITLALVAGLLAVFAASAAGQAQEEAATVGIDTDTSGNTATRVGTPDLCREAAVGDQFDIDVYVTHAERISGYEFDLHFDSAVLNLVSFEDDLFVSALPGSNPVTLSASTPTPSGTIKIAIVDFGDPATTYESGEGVFARVTLEAIGEGDSGLTFEKLVMTTANDGQPGPVEPADPVNGRYQGRVLTASVAVGGECAEPTETQPPVTLGAGRTATPGPGVTEVPSIGPTIPVPGVSPESDDDNNNWIIWVAAGAGLLLIVLGSSFEAWRRRRPSRPTDE